MAAGGQPRLFGQMEKEPKLLAGQPGFKKTRVFSGKAALFAHSSKANNSTLVRFDMEHL